MKYRYRQISLLLHKIELYFTKIYEYKKLIDEYNSNDDYITKYNFVHEKTPKNIDRYIKRIKQYKKCIDLIKANIKEHIKDKER
jgi:hypothetical protein